MRKLVVGNIIGGFLMFLLLYFVNQTSIENSLDGYSSIKDINIHEKNIQIYLDINNKNIESELNEIMDLIPVNYDVVFQSNSNRELDQFWMVNKNLFIELLLNKKISVLEKNIEKLSAGRIHGQVILGKKGVWLILKQNKYFIIKFIPVRLLESF